MALDSSRLSRLKRELERLKGEVERVKGEIQREEEHLVRVRFGVVKGTIVVDGRGCKYRVVGIELGWRDTPWLSGNPQKKDGSFGTAVRHLYTDWKLANDTERT